MQNGEKRFFWALGVRDLKVFKDFKVVKVMGVDFIKTMPATSRGVAGT